MGRDNATVKSEGHVMDTYQVAAGWLRRYPDGPVEELCQQMKGQSLEAR